MNGHFAEAVNRDEERLDVAGDAAGTVAVQRLPPDEAVEGAPGIKEQSDLTRRYALLATEAGFGLVDLCMVGLAAGAADDVVSGSPIGWISLCVALLVTNIVFSARGLYRDAPVFLRNLSIERCMMAWWHAFGCWLVVMLLIDGGMELAWTDMPAGSVAMSFHPRAIALFFFFGMVFVVAGRLALMQVFALTPVRGQVRQRTYILGAGSGGQSLAEHFAREDDPEMQVLGFFDDGASNTPPARMGGLPWQGGLGSLIKLINRGQVDVVLVTTPWSAADRIDDIMRRLAMLPVSVGLVPEQIPFRFPHRVVRSATGLPILRVCEQRLSDSARALKKLEDMILAPLLVLLLSPVMVAIALAIKLDSPGPVLFSQRRYGIDNRIITVHKFRTMHTHLSDDDCEQQTVRGDRRLTRIGKILRSLSLDELPQLFNVLTGEMSLVGPRPHALSTKAEGLLFEDAVATYMARHRVMPGITGWAQVNGWRGETDSLEKIAKRVEHDLYYIGNWSLAFDLLIIFRTMRVVFKSENAY
jgi:Undecaprenyl-phosphate glucose phosphotransferase